MNNLTMENNMIIKTNKTLYDFKKSGKVEKLKIGQIVEMKRSTCNYIVYLGDGHFSKKFSMLKYVHNFLKYSKKLNGEA
jgi:hypothetical protein